MKLPVHSVSRALRCTARAAVTALLLALVGSGCQSLNEPGSSGFASVTIQNQSPEKIAATTGEVFAAAGYRGGVTSGGKMVFEKEASRGRTMGREGVVGTYYGAQTIDRVRAEIVSLGAGAHRLQCKAYDVTGGNDPFFQDEIPLSGLRSGPYQSLLNKVRDQLK